MNKRIVWLLGLVVYSSMIVGGADNKRQMPVITMPELFDIIQNKHEHDHWCVINVLPRDMYQECCIPHSINIPVHVLRNKLQSWPRCRKIVLYCVGGDCPLSRYAYEAICTMGFAEIRVFQDGMRGWKGNQQAVQGVCKAEYLAQ